MPSIRSITADATGLQVEDEKGPRGLVASTIPASQNTRVRVEAYLTTWAAANLSDYAVAVHVYTLAPLRVAITVRNADATIPASWWNT